MLKSSPQVTRLRWRMCTLSTVLLCLCPLVVRSNKKLWFLFIFILLLGCFSFCLPHPHTFFPLLTEISCNFEVNLCGWYQDQTDNYDWMLHSGMDHTVHDGQDTSDAGWIGKWVYYVWKHPHSNTNFFLFLSLSFSGRSLVVDMWDPSLRGLSGRLLSIRQYSNSEHCLSFFYKLYGPNTGESIHLIPSFFK